MNIGILALQGAFAAHQRVLQVNDRHVEIIAAALTPRDATRFVDAYHRRAFPRLFAPSLVERVLREELPFLASEVLLMAAVKEGADRQDAHERIRLLSRQASDAVHLGEANPLRELLAADFLHPVNASGVE